MKNINDNRELIENISKCNTVIWDMDGTILDTIEDLKDSVNHVLAGNGYQSRTLEEIKRFVGNGIEKLMERAVPDGKKNPDFYKMFEEFKIYYTAHCNEKTGLYPGIKETIKYLHENGYKQAIVSNKAHGAMQELAKIYFSDEIDVALGQQDKIAKKPAPDMVELVLEKLGSSKSEAVYIGDSEVDVMTARNSGLAGIAVLWGFRTEQELIEAGAEILVDSTDELISLLMD